MKILLKMWSVVGILKFEFPDAEEECEYFEIMFFFFPFFFVILWRLKEQNGRAGWFMGIIDHLGELD